MPQHAYKSHTVQRYMQHIYIPRKIAGKEAGGLLMPAKGGRRKLWSIAFADERPLEETVVRAFYEWSMHARTRRSFRYLCVNAPKGRVADVLAKGALTHVVLAALAQPEVRFRGGAALPYIR